MAKRETKEKRVEELILAAVEEFTEKGYEGASMASIAAQAGVSKGGLYHHFSCKEEVLRATQQKLSEPIFAMVRKACDAPSPREGLRKFVEEYLDYWNLRAKELSFFLLALAKAMLWPKIRPEYENDIEGVIEAIADLYRRGVAAGEFVEHDCRGAAVTLLLALDGALAYRILDTKLGLEETYRQFEFRFITALMRAKE
jgi:AcrR family transcriptional regulator